MRFQVFLTLCLLLLSIGLPSQNLFGQNETETQIDHQWVKLIDGSRLKVASFETNSDESEYQFSLVSGGTLSVEASQIRKFKMPNREWYYNDRGNVIPTKGKYTTIAFGLLMNKAVDNQFKTLNVGWNAFQFSHGLQLFKSLSIGAGAALDIYDGEVIVPFFIEAKYLPLPNMTISPYLGTRMGAGPSFDWRGRGGAMVHPNIGLRCASKSNVQVSFEFGVRLQQQHKDFWDAIEVTTFKRYSVAMGITF